MSNELELAQLHASAVKFLKDQCKTYINHYSENKTTSKDRYHWTIKDVPLVRWQGCFRQAAPVPAVAQPPVWLTQLCFFGTLAMPSQWCLQSTASPLWLALSDLHACQALRTSCSGARVPAGAHHNNSKGVAIASLQNPALVPDTGQQAA